MRSDLPPSEKLRCVDTSCVIFMPANQHVRLEFLFISLASRMYQFFENCTYVCVSNLLEASYSSDN